MFEEHIEKFNKLEPLLHGQPVQQKAQFHPPERYQQSNFTATSLNDRQSESDRAIEAYHKPQLSNKMYTIQPP